MTVRPAVMADIPVIMAAMEAARGIMRASGNPFQWPAGYPTRAMIEGDLARGVGYLVLDGDAPAGYFAAIPSPDPTYAVIYGGAWLDNTLPYYVVHRIASFPSVHGVFSAMLSFCEGLSPNLRIDTHRDNRIMQHLLLKNGFTYCGIIHLLDGQERLAYQRLLPGA